MAEKKVGKVEAVNVYFRKDNGEKFVARANCFEGENVVVLKGQVLEARREEGSVVFVVRDRGREVTRAEFSKTLRSFSAIEFDGDADAIIDLVADALGLPK